MNQPRQQSGMKLMTIKLRRYWQNKYQKNMIKDGKERNVVPEL